MTNAIFSTDTHGNVISTSVRVSRCATCAGLGHVVSDFCRGPSEVSFCAACEGTKAVSRTEVTLVATAAEVAWEVALEALRVERGTFAVGSDAWNRIDAEMSAHCRATA